jgi:hypothetical protein
VKWFHRGRHRVGQPLEEIKHRLSEEFLPTSYGKWKISADGQYYVLPNVKIYLPPPLDGEQAKYVALATISGGITNFPALSLWDKDFAEQLCRELEL